MVASENQSKFTSFAMVEFMQAVEALLNAKKAVYSIGSRYSHDESTPYDSVDSVKRILGLIGDAMDELTALIGSDFVECVTNVTAES